MFSTNKISHLTIVTVLPREIAHVIIVVKNTMLQIVCIHVMIPISRRPRMSAQLIGAVVDAAVEVVVNAKGTTRSGARAMIIRMGIKNIMVLVFKKR